MPKKRRLNLTLKKKSKTRKRKNNQQKYKRSKKINRLRIHSHVIQKGGGNNKMMTANAARTALNLLKDNINKKGLIEYDIFYDVKYVIDKSYLRDRCGWFGSGYCNIMKDVLKETKEEMDNIEKKTTGNKGTEKTILGSNAHRAKIRGSIILNIDVLAAFFVLSMQILLIEDGRDQDEEVKSLQKLATILIKFFFIKIRPEDRNNLQKDLVSDFDKYNNLITKIENIGTTTTQTGSGTVIKIIEKDPKNERGIILRKLFEIAGEYETLRMEEVQILLRRGLRKMKGKATGLQRIECLGKLGVWVGIENINVIITAITSMAAGSTVCPYMLIPLIFILMKFMSCIVDFKMPKIISVVVFGITGMPSFDLSSLQDLAKQTGNVFKDKIKEAGEEAQQAYHNAVNETKTIINENISQTVVNKMNEELKKFEGDGELELNEDEDQGEERSLVVIPTLTTPQAKVIQDIDERNKQLDRAWTLIQKAQENMKIALKE